MPTHMGPPTWRIAVPTCAAESREAGVDESQAAGSGTGRPAGGESQTPQYERPNPVSEPCQE